MDYDEAKAILRNVNAPDDHAAEARAVVKQMEAAANAEAEARQAQRDADRKGLATALTVDRLTAEMALMKRLHEEAIENKNEQVAELTDKNTDLTMTNADLAGQVIELQDANARLQADIDSLLNQKPEEAPPQPNEKQ
jgi:hypothetical protein